jgi:hypothetical protein
LIVIANRLFFWTRRAGRGIVVVTDEHGAFNLRACFARSQIPLASILCSELRFGVRGVSLHGSPPWRGRATKTCVSAKRTGLVSKHFRLQPNIPVGVTTGRRKKRIRFVWRRNAVVGGAVDPLRTATGGTPVQRGTRKRNRAGAEEAGSPLIRTLQPVGSTERSACAGGRSLVIVWLEPSSRLGLLRKYQEPKK